MVPPGAWGFKNTQGVSRGGASWQRDGGSNSNSGALEVLGPLSSLGSSGLVPESERRPLIRTDSGCVFQRASPEWPANTIRISATQSGSDPVSDEFPNKVYEQDFRTTVPMNPIDRSSGPVPLVGAM